MEIFVSFLGNYYIRMTQINFRFELLFLEEAVRFLDELPPKTRTKVLYNMWRARAVLDPALFKKVSEHVWEFRTDFANQCIRMMAFWDKRNPLMIQVVVSHGFIKKTARLPEFELSKAKKIMSKYFQK